MIPKYKIILTIVFAVLFFVFSMLLVLMYRFFWNLTDATTTEYAATIAFVKVEDVANGESVTIITQEYDSVLMLQLNDSVSQSTINTLKTLHNGDVIRFRVTNMMQEFLENGSFVEIVSLETENQSVVSLEEYALSIRNGERKNIISSTVIIVSLLIMSIAFGVSMINDRKKAKKIENGSLP